MPWLDELTGTNYDVASCPPFSSPAFSHPAWNHGDSSAASSAASVLCRLCIKISVAAAAAAAAVATTDGFIRPQIEQAVEHSSVCHWSRSYQRLDSY